MPRFLCFAFCIAFVGLAFPAELSAAGKNVVMIVADDLGLQLGCYGDPVIQSPNLDRLSASGTRFTRAHCTTASCSASRSVMLTGCFNHATAHYGHEHGEGHFRTYEQMKSLPVLLSAAGYRTCSVGKYHLAPENVYHFERYGNDGVSNAPSSGGGEGPMRMAENASRFIAENDPRPFFLYFCTHEPHRAKIGFGNERTQVNVTPVHYDPAKMQVPPWLPDRPEVRDELAGYYEAIWTWTWPSAALLAGLKSAGHADDTLVLFLSDNGPPFPGAKTTLYEPGTNLPLIVRLPGQKPGLTTDAMVTWADLTPTILDYCDVAQPKTPAKKGPAAMPAIQGRSFLSVLGQEHPAGWDEIYASHTFHEVTNYYPMRSITSKNFKYIFNVAHQLPFPFASDLYASATWQAVLTRGDKTYGQRLGRLLHPAAAARAVRSGRRPRRNEESGRRSQIRQRFGRPASQT